jgi:hypothetical protein
MKLQYEAYEAQRNDFNFRFLSKWREAWREDNILQLTNSVAWVRERTIPTERPPLVREVSANFADWGVSYGQCGRSPTAVISVF